MPDNPLDRIPGFDRISVRAVVVPEGEDPGSALAAAGIVDPIALPIVFGENPPAAANGMTREEILAAEDLVARGCDFKGQTLDKTYTHLPVRNVQNTDLGYRLYQSGRVAGTSKP